MPTNVYILFDTYHPERYKRTVIAVFTTRKAAEAEWMRASGGTFEIEEHELLDRVEVQVRRVRAE